MDGKGASGTGCRGISEQVRDFERNGIAWKVFDHFISQWINFLEMTELSIDKKISQSGLTKQGEPLVPMTRVSPKIEIYPSYFLQKMPGTSKELFLRMGVSEKIIRIAEQLPDGLFLVLIDGWRSYEAQRFIYDWTIRQFRSAGYSEGKSEKRLRIAV